LNFPSSFLPLSPIPGFKSWFAKNAAAMLDQLADKESAQPGPGHRWPTAHARPLGGSDNWAGAVEKAARQTLLRCAAHYLG
jgi:malonyl-CoA decarboxylase